MLGAAIRRAGPGHSIDDFQHAFEFSGDGEAVFRYAAKQLGLD